MKKHLEKLVGSTKRNNKQRETQINWEEFIQIIIRAEGQEFQKSHLNKNV